MHISSWSSWIAAHSHGASYSLFIDSSIAGVPLTVDLSLGSLMETVRIGWLHWHLVLKKIWIVSFRIVNGLSRVLHLLGCRLICKACWIDCIDAIDIKVLNSIWSSHNFFFFSAIIGKNILIHEQINITTKLINWYLIMSIGVLILGKTRQYILRWLTSWTTSSITGIQKWFQKLDFIYLIMVLHLFKQIFKLLKIWFLSLLCILCTSFIRALLRDRLSLNWCWRLFTTRKSSVSWQSVLILILKLKASVLIEAVVRYLGFRLCFIVFVIASKLIDERFGHWV